MPYTFSRNPIVGYRTWRISSDYHGLALRSLHVDYVWQVDNQAACHPDGAHPSLHEPPSPGLSCSCGFYCQLPDHPLDEWEHMVRGRVRATGTVSLTGRVVRCERGYKAQYASIQSPVIIEANCSHLHGTCTNPVTTLALPENHVRDVYGHCGEHGVEFMSDPPVIVDAALWMEQTCRELEVRYPGVEFIYVDWNEYEEVEDGKHW